VPGVVPGVVPEQQKRESSSLTPLLTIGSRKLAQQL